MPSFSGSWRKATGKFRYWQLEADDDVVATVVNTSDGSYVWDVDDELDVTVAHGIAGTLDEAKRECERAIADM